MNIARDREILRSQNGLRDWKGMAFSFARQTPPHLSAATPLPAEMGEGEESENPPLAFPNQRQCLSY